MGVLKQVIRCHPRYYSMSIYDYETFEIQNLLDAIKLKNLNLSNNLKLNLIKESSGDKKLNTNLTLGQARINSKEVKKNDIFFAIRGRKNDGNKFVEEALKKKASIVVVNKIKKKLDYKKQIKVIDSERILMQR